MEIRTFPLFLTLGNHPQGVFLSTSLSTDNSVDTEILLW